MPERTPKQLELVDPIDPALNLVAEEVNPEEIHSPFIQGVIDRMLELAAGRGHSKHDSRQMVGLAAIQLGVGKRVISIDPRIVHRSEETMPGREGCWSCGDICGNVERAKEVTLEGLDRTGKHVQFKLSDFVARIVQHETDHLDGIRFPDRIPTDQPDKLHWVEPAEFADYRENWAHWPNLCPENAGKK